MLLPLKRRRCHPQLRFRRCRGRRCGIEVSLLLGGIEASQDLAGVDVSPNVHQPFNHTPADPKRQLGTEAGLNFAG